MKIVITGGHHSSALPVIEALKSSQKDLQLFWFGHRSSLQGDKNDTLEYKEITSLSIPFYDLKAGKFYRTFNIARLARIPFGFLQAFFWLYRIRPDVILSFGGYLAVPTVIAGKILGIRSLTHEQTVVVGYANKLISHFADKICISWQESAKFFPKEKVIYTGIPLRKSIFEVNTNLIDPKNGLPLIYITAGKTGSHKFNMVVKEALPELLSTTNVVHQCGDYSKYNDFEQLSEIYEEIKGMSPGVYYLKKFVLEKEIGEILNESSLVVSRAGAHIVSELLALQKPCLLIPIPWVSHNEQQLNAEMISGFGLAEILKEDDLTSKSLLERLNLMLSHLNEYRLKNQETLKLINLDSALEIANETIKLASSKK